MWKSCSLLAKSTLLLFFVVKPRAKQTTYNHSAVKSHDTQQFSKQSRDKNQKSIHHATYIITPSRKVLPLAPHAPHMHTVPPTPQISPYHISALGTLFLPAVQVRDWKNFAQKFARLNFWVGDKALRQWHQEVNELSGHHISRRKLACHFLQSVETGLQRYERWLKRRHPSFFPPPWSTSHRQR